MGLARNILRHFSLLASMPRTCSVSSPLMLISRSSDSRRACASRGRNSLICRVPRAAASVTIASLAITFMPTWMAASGQNRVDFAGHDGRACLQLRQSDFSQKIHQAQIVGNFNQIDGMGFEYSGYFDKRIGIGCFTHNIFTAGKPQSGYVS